MNKKQLTELFSRAVGESRQRMDEALVQPENLQPYVEAVTEALLRAFPQLVEQAFQFVTDDATTPMDDATLERFVSQIYRQIMQHDDIEDYFRRIIRGVLQESQTVGQ